MIRVAFVIGGYPPEEHKRRADVALSYSSAEVEVGIVDVAASPYFYGMTPTEIQLVAPAFIESFRRAEREATTPWCRSGCSTWESTAASRPWTSPWSALPRPACTWRR